MYDHNRAEKTYNPDNCKHMACSEVRGALFSSKCNPKDRSRMKIMKNSQKNKERVMANEFCVKELAIQHLKEKNKCAEKAERYVDYIFEKCKNDTAPIKGGKAAKIKSFSDIM